MKDAAAPTPDVSALMEVLEHHFTMALSTIGAGGRPYCTPVFYAVVPAHTPLLCFASHPETRHGTELGLGPTVVAAAAYGESEDLAILRGVQLTGEVARMESSHPAHAAVRSAYLRRHAAATSLLTPERPERLYALAVNWAKLTNNATLGHGRHQTWSFPEPWIQLLSAQALITR